MAESQEQLQQLPLAQEIKNVFTDGKYSDLVVTCKDRKWNVHKLVVCAQSDFFKRACDGRFVEAEENAISLSDDDPDVVDVLLHYLYHFDYCDEKGGMSPLLLNMYLLSLADKYFVHSLKDVATAKFHVRAYSDWASDGFAETLEKLYEPDFYEGSMAGLRFIMLEAVREHDTELFHDEAYTRFQVAATSSPDFMFRYIQDMTAEPSKRTNVPSIENMVWYRCPGFQCKHHKAIFGVRSTTEAKFLMNCPMRCIVNQSQDFWKQFKVTV